MVNILLDAIIEPNLYAKHNRKKSSIIIELETVITVDL